MLLSLTGSIKPRTSFSNRTDRKNFNRSFPLMKLMSHSVNRRPVAINIAAFTMLFIGYFLTTGTAIVDSLVAKDVFRILALILFSWSIVIGRVISSRILVAMLLVMLALLMNQSPFAINILYLLLMSASLYRLTDKEVAQVLLIPAVMVVFLHLILLNTGQISSQVYEITDRTRSTLGFANSNQVSIIYMSLVVLSAYAHVQFRSRWSAWMFVIALVIAFGVFGITETRTAMFSLVILVVFTILNYLLNRLKIYQQCLSMFAASLPLAASLVTYHLATSTNIALDALLSLRPSLFSQFIAEATTFDILFGWSSDVGVDNLFLMLLSSVGLIAYIAIITYICACVSRIDVNIVHLVVVLMVASVFEAFLIRPEIPLAALFIRMLFSRNIKYSKSSVNKLIS